MDCFTYYMVIIYNFYRWWSLRLDDGKSWFVFICVNDRVFSKLIPSTLTVRTGCQGALGSGGHDLSTAGGVGSAGGLLPLRVHIHNKQVGQILKMWQGRPSHGLPVLLSVTLWLVWDQPIRNQPCGCYLGNRGTGPGQFLWRSHRKNQNRSTRSVQLPSPLPPQQRAKNNQWGCESRRRSWTWYMGLQGKLLRKHRVVCEPLLHTEDSEQEQPW